MHWIDACRKSKYNTAIRIDKRYKKIMRRTMNYCSVEIERGIIRDALDGEAEGYLDWEPEAAIEAWGRECV